MNYEQGERARLATALRKEEGRRKDQEAAIEKERESWAAERRQLAAERDVLHEERHQLHNAMLKMTEEVATLRERLRLNWSLIDLQPHCCLLKMDWFPGQERILDQAKLVGSPQSVD